MLDSVVKEALSLQVRLGKTRETRERTSPLRKSVPGQVKSKGKGPKMGKNPRIVEKQIDDPCAQSQGKESGRRAEAEAVGGGRGSLRLDGLWA